jgi:hypothetical protein
MRIPAAGVEEARLAAGSGHARRQEWWSEEEQKAFLHDVRQRSLAVLELLASSCPALSIRRRVWSLWPTQPT